MTSRSALLDNLKTQASIFQKQALKTRRNPTNKKSVHQLRITVRRIRAALWLAEHGTPSLIFGKLKVKLRSFGQTLGRLREIDVAFQDAEKYHLDTNRLKKKRKSALRDLKRIITSKQSLKISSALDKAIAKINEHRELNINSGVSLLQKKILPWTNRTLTADEDFHNLRIITKKTRYALETIGKPIQPLRDLQEILGKGHDLKVLQDFLGETPMLQSEMIKQYKEARRLIRPTIRFVINNLKL